MQDVELDYVVPAADLKPYVSVFYVFRSQLEALDEVERAQRAQLRFVLAGSPGAYRFPDGQESSPAPVHLVAATTGAIRMRASGPLEVFGIGLTPAAWGALVAPAQRLARVLDAAALFGDRIAGVADALRAAPDPPAMAQVGEGMLRRLIGPPDRATLAFVEAVDGWLAGSASPDLDALVAATRLSRRQVERRCNALYGAPPKLLARKYRALRAAVALATEATTIDALIADGFYDQSHLIREVKQFTGLTPRQIARDPGLLARLTIQGRAALRGQVGPLVSDA